VHTKTPQQKKKLAQKMDRKEREQHGGGDCSTSMQCNDVHCGTKCYCKHPSQATASGKLDKPMGKCVCKPEDEGGEGFTGAHCNFPEKKKHRHSQDAAGYVTPMSPSLRSYMRRVDADKMLKQFGYAPAVCLRPPHTSRWLASRWLAFCDCCSCCALHLHFQHALC
jgi:hypothetical protein